MVEAGAEARCLFTGEVLDEATREEHTLPRSLGGRFRSRRVTSSTFNQSCSPYDDALHAAYAVLFHVLRPRLAKEHAQAALDIEIGGVDFRAGDDGVADVAGLDVTERDGTGRPKQIRGNRAAVYRHAQENNWGEEGRDWFYDEIHVGDGVGFRNSSILSPNMELAALRSIILTFDETLADDPHRFTRSPWLTDVVRRIRVAVTSNRASDVMRVARLSCGINHVLRDEIRALRDQHRPQNHQASEFEHVVVASGDSQSGFIHLGWLLADVDPWCFRVSGLYQGPDFTAVVASGVLAETHPWERAILVKGTRFRTSAFETPLKSDARARREASDIAVQRLIAERHSACRRATDLIERTADAWLDDQFREASGRLGAERANPPFMEEIIYERLRVLFADRLERDGASAELSDALARAVRDLPQAVREQRAQNMSPERWRTTYRRVLDSVRPTLGLAGSFTSLITQATEGDVRAR